MKLMPGSSIELHVFEEPDLDGTYRLDNQGNISLPLAGTVRLESLSLREAEKAINTKLVEAELLKSPHSVVNLDEYSAQNIVVLGEVGSPGRFPVLGPRRLIDVLVMAGGQTAFAGNEIVVHRFGQPEDATETIHYGRSTNNPKNLNVMINPGDTVLVKRAGIVYILGAVNRPGGYVMQEAGELTFDEALALALGTAPEAKVSGIRVFRKQADGSIVELEVNYAKVNSGKQAPLRLEARDVIYVPPSLGKTILVHGTQVLAAAASATIYTLY
jgi:polysaccharide export outer membrane protein